MCEWFTYQLASQLAIRLHSSLACEFSAGGLDKEEAGDDGHSILATSCDHPRGHLNTCEKMRNIKTLKPLDEFRLFNWPCGVDVLLAVTVN